MFATQITAAGEEQLAASDVGARSWTATEISSPSAAKFPATRRPSRTNAAFAPASPMPPRTEPEIDVRSRRGNREDEPVHHGNPTSSQPSD